MTVQYPLHLKMMILTRNSFHTDIISGVWLVVCWNANFIEINVPNNGELPFFKYLEASYQCLKTWFTFKI